MLAEKINLLPKKKLEFEIIKNITVGDYDIYWKVLSRGDEAKKKRSNKRTNNKKDAKLM